MLCRKLLNKETNKMKRTIKIDLDTTILPDNQEQINKAMVRLIHWGSDSYPEVAIYNDGKNDMVAVYFSEAGERRYVIGAVWRPESNEYTFHS
jgi:hypothetical protein